MNNSARIALAIVFNASILPCFAYNDDDRFGVSVNVGAGWATNWMSDSKAVDWKKNAADAAVIVGETNIPFVQGVGNAANGIVYSLGITYEVFEGIDLGILGFYMGGANGKITKAAGDLTGQSVEYKYMSLLAQARCNYMFDDNFGMFIHAGFGASRNRMKISEDYIFDAKAQGKFKISAITSDDMQNKFIWAIGGGLIYEFIPGVSAQIRYDLLQNNIEVAMDTAVGNGTGSPVPDMGGSGNLITPYFHNLSLVLGFSY